MALAKFQKPVQDSAGNIVTNITVTVRKESDNSLADLFEEEAGTTPLSNPATFADGVIEFYAAGNAGGLRLDIAATGYSATLRNEPCGTGAQRDIEDLLAVESVVAGPGISVDDTDPSNPIVSSVAIATRTAMSALTASAGDAVYLREAGREGTFVFDDSDLSTEVTADTAEGIYVAPDSDTDGSSGAWVRAYKGPIFVEWFGAVGDDATTDDETAINAAASFIATFGGSIELQAKRYRMSEPLAASFAQGVRGRLFGQGKDNSHLVFDAGVDGLDISIDGDDRNDGASFIWDDFSLVTLGDRDADAATFTGTRTAGKTTSMLASSRIKMMGVDETKGWDAGALHDDINGVDYYAPEWLGKQNDKTSDAFQFGGSNSPTDIRLTNPRATFFQKAVHIQGTVEGIIIRGPTFVSGVDGVYHDTTAAEPHLEVSGGHINTNRYGVYSAKAIQSAVYANDIYEDLSGGGTTWVGIQFVGGADNKIFGNTIHGWDSSATTRNGIVLGSTPVRTLVFGNTIRGYDGTDKLTNGIVLDGTEDASVQVFNNSFQDSSVTTRVSGGATTGARQSRQYAATFVKTLTGGATTETIDFALPSGMFTTDPDYAQVVDESGAEYLVGNYNYGVAATTPTNVRFVVTRADGANISAGAHRFGLLVMGV